MPRVIKRQMKAAKPAPGKKMPKEKPSSGMAAGGMQMNKAYGQHLLKNPGILDKIIKAAEIKQTDHVLEIGPGTGNLTVQMLPLARRVVAIEIDQRMVAEVRKRVSGSGRTNFEVKEGDALRTEFGRFDVCVANLPYQISSPFTFRLLAHRPLFRCAVLMFQKEFAERLVAETGDANYGRLALNTRLFVKVTRVCKVSRGSFSPPPEVDSMVVKLVPRNPPIQINFREWDGMLRICFNRKRKTLYANFNNKTWLKTLEENYKTWCSLTNAVPVKGPFKDIVFGVLKDSGLSGERAIRIDMDNYFKLLLAFNQKGVHFVSTASAAAPAEPDVAMFADDAEMDDA